MSPIRSMSDIHDQFNGWDGVLDFLAQNYRERTALEIRRQKVWQPLRYGELVARARALAHELGKRGVAAGDRVAILGDSSPEWAISFLAGALAGAILVPFDAKLTEGELGALARHAEPKLALVSESRRAIGAGLAPSLISFDEIAGIAGDMEPSTVRAGWPARAPRDPLMIVYTSGTSGSPKGVTLSSANLLFDIQAQFRILPAGPHDTYLSILPLNHLFELTCGLLRPLVSGSTVYYADSLMPSEIKAVLCEKRIKSMLTVPLFLRGLKKGIERELSSSPARRRYALVANALARAIPFMAFRRKVFAPVLKSFGGRLDCFVCGGAALEREVGEFFSRMGIHVLQGYGLTETSPTSTVNSFRHNRLGSVGRPIPGAAIRIARTESAARATSASRAGDGEGEVLIRGPHVMLGYYRREDLTREAIDAEGWFHTGDLGRVDAQGFLHLTGRAKELIVLPSGKKVAPEEVEEGFAGSLRFKEHCVLAWKGDAGLKKGVEEICLIAVPSDELRAEAATPGADARSAADRMAHALVEEARELSLRMASYKRPSRLVIFEGELPKTTTRKLKRHEVRAIMERGEGLRFETLST